MKTLYFAKFTFTCQIILLLFVLPITGLCQHMDYLYDPSFTPPNVIGGSSDAAARIIIVHEDGRYLIAGSHQVNIEGNETAINRFLNNGALDPSFIYEYDTFSLAYIFPFQDDYLINNSTSLVELNNDGSHNVPPQFRIPYMHPPYDPPTWPGPTSNWAQVIEDDKLMVAGRFSPDTTDLLDRRHLIRVFSDGTPDTTFTPLKCHEPYDAYIMDFYPTINGKWMVVGRFTDVEGFLTPGIARLNEDFSVDTTFVSPFSSYTYNLRILGGDDGTTLAGTIDEQGRVYIRHKKNITDWYPEFVVSRLLLDGTIDSTFTQPELLAYSPDGESTISAINDIAFEPDGTIIIGGRFHSVDGHPRGGIAKLNEDGSLVEEVFNRQGADTVDWQDGSTSNLYIPNVSRIVRLPNGGLLVGGLFSRYDGVEQWGLVRLLPSPVGIEEPARSSAIEIKCFPNPASDWVQMEIPKQWISRVGTIQLYNNAGKLVYEHSAALTQYQSIHVEDLPSGIYSLNIRSGTERGIAKLVIE